MSTPPTVTVSDVTRNVAWGTGAVKRTSSSTAWGTLLMSACERAELIGMVEEGDDTVADQARGRVVSGDDQLEQAGQQLLRG